MQSNTLAVGITGGIGSGKSLICKIFESLEIPVYYADERAKWLQSNNVSLVNAIKEAFGKDLYNDAGDLNRVLLAKQVFNNDSKLTLLDSLVHPIVAQDYKEWHTRQVHVPYTLKEAALLFETGSYQSLDKIINVNASVEVRLKRVLLRDAQRSKEQVLSIMAKQWDDRERANHANYTIENNEGSQIVPRVLEIHQKLLRKAAHSTK